MTQVITIHNSNVLEAAMAKYLKVSLIAKRYGVSTRTVLRWIHGGLFPGAFKLDPTAKNSHFVVPENDLKLFEEERKSPLSEGD